MGAVPVQMYNQCYVKNGLVNGYNFKNENAPVNFPATRSGYAMIGLSSPSGSWEAKEEDIGIVIDQ